MGDWQLVMAGKPRRAELVAADWRNRRRESWGDFIGEAYADWLLGGKGKEWRDR
ncbi:hypothetical protein N9Y55_01175 [bacterium]|nr:hypothetical protein [bacterium]